MLPHQRYVCESLRATVRLRDWARTHSLGSHGVDYNTRLEVQKVYTSLNVGRPSTVFLLSDVFTSVKVTKVLVCACSKKDLCLFNMTYGVLKRLEGF